MEPPNPLFTRRSVLQLGALTLSALPLAACATRTAQSAPAPNNITIGYVPIACTAPLIMADAQGLFKEQGLNVVLKKYSGWADLWSAYTTGEFDVAHMLSPMPVAINSGATNATRPTEICFTQNTNGQAITLATRHHPTIRTAADFAGLTIGIPFEFSVHALLLRDFLAAGGLDPVADLELRLLRPADMIAQLQVGGIDGFIGPEPFNQRAVASGVGKIFTLTKDLWNGHPCCSVAMAKDWRANHPHQAAGLIAALSQAVQLLGDNHQHNHVAETLSKEKYLNQPAKLFLPALNGTYENWDGKETHDPQRIIYGGETSLSAVTWMAAQIARWKLGGSALTMNDVAIMQAAEDVLASEIPRTVEPLRINGKTFDPNIPTAGH